MSFSACQPETHAAASHSSAKEGVGALPKVSSTNIDLPDLDSDFNKFFNPVELVLQLCKGLQSSHTGLSAFIRHSLRLDPACTVDMGPTSSVWPVPPVRWRWTDCRHLSPKRRRRLKFHRAVHSLVNVVICSLNWEVLGFPREPPRAARIGAHISIAQHEVISRIESMVVHFVRMAPFASTDLGRIREKLSGVIKSVQELAWCKLSFEDLTELAEDVHGSLDPYGKHFASQKEPTPKSQHSMPEHQCFFGDSAKSALSGNSANAMTVRPERVKWKSPPSFAASEFLKDPLLKSAYEDPEVLRRPAESWPKVRPAKVHCSKQDFLQLAERWDRLGACMLIPACEKDFSEAVGLFCVPKDEEHDRLIVNPQVINSRMFSLASSTRELAPGCLLTMLHLEPHEIFRFNADDLSDYYYTFKVSPLRAKRNAFRVKLHGSDVRHFSCFSPDMEGKELLLCLKTLAMGDNLAVEVAQSAHASVLRILCSAMRTHEVLKYRWPIPRSPFIELLAIDDHVGIQKLPRAQFASMPVLRDTEVFEQAERAYDKVGLILQEKKKKRNLTEGVVLGADFDGIEGKVMAPRHRILLLSMISVAIAQKGTCTPKLLSTILGSWVHVLLFRRALFSVVDDLFKQGRDVPAHTVFCLSRQARNELLLLAALGCVAQSNLRAKYSDQIFTTDASPLWGAVCQASVSPAATQELWRHSEQRGYYTRLKSPASAVLSELGIQSAVDEQYAHDPYDINPLPTPQSVPKPLSEGILYDCCELFRGTGNWSSIHATRGLTCHDGFDVDGRRLRCGDLSSSSVFSEVMGLAARRVVREWHAGVPCLSFGTLRRPHVRSKQFPFGFDPSDPFTAYHNMLARRAALILTLAVMLGQFISVEQPRGSRMFLLHCFQTLIKLGCIISHFAFCAFGSGFHKASKWLHNKPWLVPLESKCSCPPVHQHFTIEGTFTKSSILQFDRMCRPSCLEVYGEMLSPGMAVSAFSASYPMRLIEQMASGSLAAKHGEASFIPASCKLRSLLEVGLQEQSPSFLPSTADEFPQRSWFENPEWHHELCEFLHFRETFRYKFKRPGHINVNEMRTYKSWMKAMAKSSPASRFVGLLDSRVTIGAASKGRSSSYALSKVLKGCLEYVIGGDLYPGLLHMTQHGLAKCGDPLRRNQSGFWNWKLDTLSCSTV